MKYKLLKDLPTIKAGTIFQEITREVDGSKILKEYDSTSKITILANEIKNFDEWFEEVEEMVNSIHWKPKYGDKYFHGDTFGNVSESTWEDKVGDMKRLNLGLVFSTEKGYKQARDRRLVEVRLRLTSTFEPDFKSKNGGFAVGYDYCLKELFPVEISGADYGEIVRYETRADAKKSIKENERDWKIYFGVEEEKK